MGFIVIQEIQDGLGLLVIDRGDDDHVVARVFQPGYVFAGQLLRPARVVVKQWNG